VAGGCRRRFVLALDLVACDVVFGFGEVLGAFPDASVEAAVVPALAFGVWVGRAG
jgi:hypothetical protein